MMVFLLASKVFTWRIVSVASDKSFLAHSTANCPFSFNSILFLPRVNRGTPKLGYGVYQTPPEDTKRCVLDAIAVGYRSIDTAQAYSNEEGVGTALAESGLPREEFFLTTKVWITNAGYEKAKASIEESLKKLGTDYIDLLLIHQPFGDYYGTYRAMEEFYEAGKIRAIGVSNFGLDRYLDLQHFARIKPAVNQIETHVFQQQKAAREYLKKYNCQIESWGPFAEGRKDMAAIAALDGGESLFFSHYDPQTVEWFLSIV